MLDSLVAAWYANKIIEEYPVAGHAAHYTLFRFNPNTVTHDELLLLGFSDRLATRLLNYRTRGTFRTRRDMLRLYGMDSLFYEALYPFIDLPEKITYEKKSYAAPSSPAREKSQPFNLNEADTLHLVKIYGIGSTLSKRIIKYREKLGGFVGHHQLGEVYGLDSAVIGRIIAATYLPGIPSVNKINLNTADEKTFAAHPYIGRKLAQAIVAYRFQHGNFKTVDDLRSIALIDKDNLGKLFPYVTVDP
jgi:competence protein ComEA